MNRALLPGIESYFVLCYSGIHEQAQDPVFIYGLVLEFTCGDHRLVLFPDGRVLVMGAMDTAEARSLVARYIGS